MLDHRFLEFMQRKEYPNIIKKTNEELDGALENLLSKDINIRKQGAKRLSWNARKELGWNCYPTRVWFLDKQNTKHLLNIIKSENDLKLQCDLIRTLAFFYERYILHSFWENVTKKSEQNKFKSELEELAGNFVNSSSSEVLAEIAFIFAMIGNHVSWDIYEKVLEKRASVVSRFRAACISYSNGSITSFQKNNLKQHLLKIISRTKNINIKIDAEYIIANYLNVD